MPSDPGAGQERGIQSAPDDHQVIATIDLGLGIGQGEQAAAFSPANGWTYVANTGSDDVSILSGTEVITMAAVGQAPVATAADPAAGQVYVANRDSCDLSVLSGTRVIGSIPLGQDCGSSPTPPPWDVAVHPTTGLVYVTNPASETVPIISGTAVITQVTVPGAPWAMAVQPVTGLVYVANGYDQVTVLSGTAIVAGLPLSWPRAMDADPDSGLVYVTGYASNTVAVLSGTAVVTTVVVGEGPVDVGVSPRTGWAYVAGEGDRTVTVLSATGVLTTIPVGITPTHVAAHPSTSLVYVGAAEEVAGRPALVLSGTTVLAELADAPVQDVAFDLTRGWAYLVGASQATIVDGAVVVARVKSPPVPSAMAIHPDSGWLYLSSASNDTVYVISGTELLASAGVGESPQAIAAHPGSGLVYVANFYGESVSVLSGTAALATVEVGQTPRAVEANPATGLVYVANSSSDTVSVLGGTAVVTTVAAPWPMDVAADAGAGLVYAISYEGTVTVLSGTGVLTTVGLGEEIVALWDVEIDPQRNWAYVADQRGQVWIISGTTSLGSVPVPTGGCDSVRIHPVSGRAYVGGGDFAVAVLDGMEVIAEIPMDSRAVAVHPALNYAYATTEGAVAVIVGTTVADVVQVSGWTSAIAVHPGSGYVYVGNDYEHSVSVLGTVWPQRLYLPYVSKEAP